MAKNKNIRIDQYIVEKGLAPSVERAQALILAGEVYLGTEQIQSGAQKIALDQEITIRGAERFVSRGGIKLEKALTDFKIAVDGKTCADVGAATGGFSDALLQRGAGKVFAVDVGYGDLHWKVRSNPRVVPIERTNARYLESLPELVSLIAVDVSFISVSLLFDNLYQWLAEQGELIILLKPQFEAEQEEVSKGEGIVSDKEIYRRVINRAINDALKAGFSLSGLIQSPITGTHGNHEFLLWFSKGVKAADLDQEQLIGQALEFK